MISFGPLDPATELDALLRASAAHFGGEGYQHLPRYVEWLYSGNPAGRGPSDCIVARRDGAVVGCMHRMRLPLAEPHGATSLAVLHNHFVAEELRSGPGVLLLRRAIKDVGSALAPGVQAPLDQVYRRLGLVEQPGFWLVRTVSALGAAAQLARARLGRPGPLRVDVASLRRRFPRLAVTAQPAEEEIGRLCATILTRQHGEADAAAVAWTPALVRWRYFHPSGPRHLLVAGRDPDAMAVISLGRRRGLSVARLMEFTGDGRFAAEVMRVMRAAGAAMALAFSTDFAKVDLLKAQGWRLRDNGTFSFRTAGPALAIGPAATDVGFEAFATEWS